MALNWNSIFGKLKNTVGAKEENTNPNESTDTKIDVGVGNLTNNKLNIPSSKNNKPNEKDNNGENKPSNENTDKVDWLSYIKGERKYGRGGSFVDNNKKENEALKSPFVKKTTVQTPLSMRYTVGRKMYTPEELKKAQESGEVKDDEKIDLAEVESTAVDRIRYDKKSKTLFVTFKGGKGKEYAYPNVPVDAVKQLQDSVSKGTFMANNIGPKYAVKGFRASWK